MVNGAIRPIAEGPGFSRHNWCEFVRRRAEFRRPAPQQARNPFTGESVTVRPTEDVAHVIHDGRKVGSVWWSMNEELLVNVEIEPGAITLVHEWASELGGEFNQYPSVEE